MKQYHVSVNGQQPSVVAEEVLSKEAAEGKYPENTLIWCEGMAGWEPIGNHFRRPASPPPIPAAASAAACAVPAGKPDVAQENQASVGRPRTGRSVPSYVWNAGLWFLVSLFFLFCALFCDMKGYLQIKCWLVFLGTLGWGIHALDAGATEESNNKKES